ncbi:MAG: kelch repeat-containing protein [Chthoniobacterales bacterium]
MKLIMNIAPQASASPCTLTILSAVFLTFIAAPARSQSEPEPAGADLAVRTGSAVGTWNNAGRMTTHRTNHTATLLSNGQVLVTGGENADMGYTMVLGSAELFDPATKKWTATASLITSREFDTATLLPSGQVLVAGGYAGPDYLKSAELYDPTAQTWSGTGDMRTARVAHTATLLPSGKVLVAAGSDGTNLLSSATLYNPANGKWSNASNLATARDGHTATLLPSGKVLVAGGIAATNYTLDSAELYDPATGAWTPTGSLSTSRFVHTATLLPSGKVLVTGGASGFYPNLTYLSSAEIYDPATGVWTATGSMGNARYNHTATLLPSGKVVAAAGYSFPAGGYLTSAELYDPAIGTWTATGSLATRRYQHTATLLPSGRVLVAGGYNDSDYFLKGAEQYR